MIRDLLPAVVACLLAGTPACTGDATSPQTDSPETTTPPPDQPPPNAAATGTIAYARGSSIRLVEPDGSGDRALWSAPNPQPSYSARGLVWNPAGAELAFSSDHEMATSLYERDIYTLSGDGRRLRKLTNGPSHAELAALPKGDVTVRVQNNTRDAGPFVIYVVGAAAPLSPLVPPGTTKTLTFTGVADLGRRAQRQRSTEEVTCNHGWTVGARRWSASRKAAREGAPRNPG